VLQTEAAHGSSYINSGMDRKGSLKGKDTWTNRDTRLPVNRIVPAPVFTLTGSISQKSKSEWNSKNHPFRYC
jgi:hypothetical protein